MRKILIITSLLALVACSTSRNPAHNQSPDEAYSSAAAGNIKVVAKRYYQQENFCFDLTMKLKGIKKTEAQWSNWDVSYVDASGKSQAVALTDRNPASTEGGVVLDSQYFHEEYVNQMKHCLPAKQIIHIQLTPKKLSYGTKPLTLTWN
jgi:hypothetical protein